MDLEISPFATAEALNLNYTIADIVAKNMYQYINYNGNKVIRALCCHHENMLQRSYSNNILYYLAKNGDIKMFEHIKSIKALTKWTEKALVSYCHAEQKIKPLDVALLYNQTKCVEWLHKQTGSNPKQFTNDELDKYLESLNGFFDRSPLYVQLLYAQKAQNRDFGKIFN